MKFFLFPLILQQAAYLFLELAYISYGDILSIKVLQSVSKVLVILTVFQDEEILKLPYVSNTYLLLAV
jgi:hypothetical protein